MLEAADTRKRQAEQAILDHLARHPLAADTEPGIAQWWLGAAGVLVTPVELQQALASLLQQGLVECIALPDGGTLYRAASSAAPGRH